MWSPASAQPTLCLEKWTARIGRRKNQIMQLPPSLETKFNELAGRYPVKRSALIPMMLYAQDQFGSLSDEILQEIATRLDLNMIQVEETLSYYSMLRRKPAGRNHIQVCTNISCMLRGGNELYKHVQKR